MVNTLVFDTDSVGFGSNVFIRVIVHIHLYVTASCFLMVGVESRACCAPLLLFVRGQCDHASEEGCDADAYCKPVCQGVPRD